MDKYTIGAALGSGQWGVVRKATRGYWDKPGRIYAPITKANYRDGLKLTDCNRTY